MDNDPVFNESQASRRRVLRTLSGLTALSATSAVTSNAVAAETSEQRWVFATGDSIESSATIIQDTVFVGSDNLYALDAGTGDEQWRFETDNVVWSSPLVVDNTVFFGSFDEKLYAVDAATGNQHWNFQTGNSVVSSPVVADGSVFFGSRDNNLYSVDATTGDQQWVFETNGEIWSSPAILNDIVFVGSNDENLYAIDASEGDQKWVFETNFDVIPSPTAADGTVFAASHDWNLYALDIETGQSQWSFQANNSLSTPTVMNETVFVGSADNNLYAVDSSSGNQKWKFETGGSIGFSPTVVNNTVFVGSHDNRLYAVNAKTGDQQWAFETDGEIWAAPTVADGTVFVGSSDGNVYAVDTGIAGSSNGSRARLATLGHHDDWRYADQSIAIPTPDESSSQNSQSAGSEPDEAPSSGLNTLAMIAIGGGTVGATIYGWRRLRQSNNDTAINPSTPDRATQDSDTINNRPEEVNEEITQSNRQDDSQHPDQRAKLNEQIESLHSEIEHAVSLTVAGNLEQARKRLSSVKSDLSAAKDIAAEEGLDDLHDEITTLKERHETCVEDVINQIKTYPVPDTIPREPDISVAYDALNDKEPIGAGGNADVTKATLSTTDGVVTLAIKEPRMSGTLYSDQAEKMLQEAEMWDNLDDHDHIVGVCDYGSTPVPWIAVEYMDGGHLGEQHEDMDTKQALWTAIAITKGVRHAHRRGVAHLDLKPENILFREVENAWNVPKVADWGLSKHLLEHSKSVEGMSVEYAAPEQFDDEYGSADDITDVYQLGAVFYELFTGRPPFEGRKFKLIDMIKNSEPTPPSEIADVPDGLDDILLTALRKEKDERYESVLLLRNDLQELFDS